VSARADALLARRDPRARPSNSSINGVDFKFNTTKTDIKTINSTRRSTRNPPPRAEDADLTAVHLQRPRP
jgi:hypothetical protein